MYEFHEYKQFHLQQLVTFFIMDPYILLLHLNKGLNNHNHFYYDYYLQC